MQRKSVQRRSTGCKENYTGSWGYKLYSPSLVDAQKGNFDVWFWTDLDKAPEGEITNWEPTILVHWG